jgi:predicted metal-binding membrane protein
MKTYKIWIFAATLSLVGALFPLVTQAADGDDKVNCAILPQSICDAATTPADKGDVSRTGVFQLLVWAINILTAMVGIVAVGVLIYAGIMYASAGDNSQQVSSAKGMITNTVIGIVSFGLMYFVLNWLIPGGVIG